MENDSSINDDIRFKTLSRSPSSDCNAMLPNTMQSTFYTIVPVAASLLESVKPQNERNKQFGTYNTSALLQTMYNAIVSRTYRFPLTRSGHVSVQELMLESCLTYHVPIIFLQICIDQESKRISALESIGKLTGHWDAVRQRQLAIHRKYIERYESSLTHLLQRYHPPYFKKSADKTADELNFVPTNLHLQRMRVAKEDDSAESESNGPPPQISSFPVSGRKSWSEYDVVTVGAATTHSLHYKQGGLLALLARTDDNAKSKKGLPIHPIAHCLQRGISTNDNTKLITQIKCLQGQVRYQIEKLKTLISKPLSDSKDDDVYSTDNVTSSHEALVALSQKVCELTTFTDSVAITTAVTVLAAARPVSRSMFDDYVRKNPPTHTQDLQGAGPSVSGGGEESQVSFQRLKSFAESESSVESLWEEINLCTKSTLADVVKSVHGIITPNLEENFLRGEVSSDNEFSKAKQDLASLQELVDKISSESLLALTFQNLTSDDLRSDPDLTYRRNAVFSQALGMCVGGVSTLIASSVDDDLKLHQFAEVGIFLQVESLLSTYGNELGMLQDYTVGVMDLLNVTFKCVRASKQPSRINLSSGNVPNEFYLPTLHGSIDALTVSLQFDDDSFAKLPSNLQSGRLIKIHPVIYNVGINEEQTLAEKFGTTALQDYLNLEALSRTLQYYDLVRDNCPSSISEKLRNANSFLNEISRPSQDRRKSSSPFPQFSEQRPLMDLLNSLSVSVKSKKNKNVEILQLSAEICRRMNGVRVTSCKSAKDRTAMSVTLEQARVLVSEHGMESKVFPQALACMRSQGTRRENTAKNTGNRRYAFTSVQLMTFPKLYKPPDGTYGKNES
ncbi:inositol polyphosphate-4-phosphatase type I A-like isoform X2 [Clavelina lepadiformis]|uniref:inositol polyphosphate-4-phosphatase type I A-like isoform X2 n=1 Tax=Clavelina lepadiformis TaxID=159417 RepID=UPI00404359B9